MNKINKQKLGNKINKQNIASAKYCLQGRVKVSELLI